MGTGSDEGQAAPSGPDGRALTGSSSTVGSQRKHNLWTYGATGGRFVREHLRTAVVMAIALTAGATLGYVGHPSTSALTSSRMGPHAGPNAGSESSAVRHGPLISGSGAGAANVPSGDIACPMMSGTADPSTGGQGSASTTHLFTRTTADNVTIRAYRLPTTGICGCGPIISNSPVAGPDVSLEMSDTTAVGLGDLFAATDPSATTLNASTEPEAAVSNAFGVTEGAPVWWVAVAVGPEVANVQMTFADGSTDHMAPVDGVAVLAHQIDPGVAATGSGPDDVRGTLTLFDSSGTVVATVSFPQVTPPVQPLPEQISGSEAASSAAASPPVAFPPTTVVSPPASEYSGTACPDLSVPAKAAPGKGGSGQSAPSTRNAPEKPGSATL
jgi:hypothetical protein